MSEYRMIMHLWPDNIGHMAVASLLQAGAALFPCADRIPMLRVGT